MGLTICFPSGRVTRAKDLRVGLLKALDIGLIPFPLKSRELYRWFRWKRSAADAEHFPSTILSPWRGEKRGWASLSCSELCALIRGPPGKTTSPFPSLSLSFPLLSPSLLPPVCGTMARRECKQMKWQNLGDTSQFLTVAEALTRILCLNFSVSFLNQIFFKAWWSLLVNSL